MSPDAGLPGGADVPRPTSALAAPATTQDDPFTRFVRDTFGIVTRCARRWCQDEASVPDLVQESYIKVFRTHSTTEELQLGYVLKALRWTLTDNFRKEERERRYLGEAGRFEIGKLVDDPGRVVADRAEIIWLAENFMDPERTDLAQRQRQWEVLVLTALGGYNANEIGHILGLAPGTVRNYLTLIRAKLKELRAEQ